MSSVIGKKVLVDDIHIISKKKSSRSSTFDAVSSPNEDDFRTQLISYNGSDMLISRANSTTNKFPKDSRTNIIRSNDIHNLPNNEHIGSNTFPANESHGLVLQNQIEEKYSVL